MFLQDIHAKPFADGFRDEIFDTKIVAALRHALANESQDLSNSEVEFFTAAMAQGALNFFYGRFISKYSQRDFGTGYLTQRSSPHLDVH